MILSRKEGSMFVCLIIVGWEEFIFSYDPDGDVVNVHFPHVDVGGILGLVPRE